VFGPAGGQETVHGAGRGAQILVTGEAQVGEGGLSEVGTEQVADRLPAVAVLDRGIGTGAPEGFKCWPAACGSPITSQGKVNAATSVTGPSVHVRR
jgi:hypothetical protein